MKQITKQKKDQNGAEFSSSEKQLLNKKRRKLTKDNIELGKKSGPKSLDYITKEVINYIIKSKSDYINLNKISNDNKKKKRRLYDVINVLQGK